jgi:CcmD family protein
MTIKRKAVWGSGRWLLRALAVALLAGAVPGGGSVAAAQPPQTTAAQDQYVPIDQLPPGDTLPAAPLLIAAYAVAWLVVFGYLWSIWRRLMRVERDIAEVGRRIDAGARR